MTYGRPHPGGARRNAGRRGSTTWSHYATPTLREAISRRIRDRPGTILHFEDPGVGLAGLGLGAALTVYAPHNVEHRIVREVAAASGPTVRPFLELEWRKIAREERRLWRAFDLCLAVSEIDATTMRSGGAARVELCPNGADDVPEMAPAPLDGAPLRLLFVGTADYWPYELGIAWFVREVMPALRADGDVRFDVVGAPPAEPVVGDGVTYHGRVPDVLPYYERAHALVIPVFQGSGTRLKAVEAAVLGRPLVSTALGVEGLPLRAGEDYMRAETPAEWVAAIGSCASDLRGGSSATRPLVTAARRACEPLTWPRIVEGLVGLYETELEAASQMTSTR